VSDKVKIGDFVRIRIPNRLGQVGNHYSDTVYESDRGIQQNVGDHKKPTVRRTIMAFHILNSDHDTFKESYPDAYDFMVAATVRYDCFMLCASADMREKHANEREVIEIKQLLTYDACREQWFLDSLNKLFPQVMTKLGLFLSNFSR